MKPLDLDVEDGIGVDFDVVGGLHELGEGNLVGLLGLEEGLLEKSPLPVS